jgi:drug/metabolite transporter (DMT)-like permease
LHFKISVKAKMKRESTLTYYYLTIAMICWGLSFVWYKQALQNFPPLSLVLARLVISFPLILVAALSMKRLKRVSKADISLFFILAFFEPLLYFLGESFGMQYVSSTTASIIIATIPLFTSIAAYFFLSEKLSANNYLGMIVSFAGVLFVVFSDRNGLGTTLKGILLMLLAVFSAIGYGFMIKKIAGKYNSLTIVTVQNMIGAIYFLPLFLMFDLKKVLAVHWKFSMVLPVIYLAVFASTIAYVGFIQGVRKLGISRATVFTNFIPVFTAIFALILLKESISLVKIIGIVFVVGGLIMSQANTKKIQPKSEEVIVDELY